MKQYFIAQSRLTLKEKKKKSIDANVEMADRG